MMQRVSLLDVQLWYLKDEFDKYQNDPLFRKKVKEKWNIKSFSIKEALNNIDKKEKEILNKLTKFFMVDIRQNVPEPLYRYISNKIFEEKWFSGQVFCNEVWIDSFGIPGSKIFELFKNKSELKSIVKLTSWLTHNAKKKLTHQGYKNIKHYLPIDVNKNPQRRPMKIAVLRNSPQDNLELKYRILQGLHRIIQHCSEGKKQIDAFICIDNK